MLNPRMNSPRPSERARMFMSLYTFSNPFTFEYTRADISTWGVDILDDWSSSSTAFLRRPAVRFPPSRPCLTSSSLN